MIRDTHDVIFRLFQRIVQLVDDDVEFRSDLCILVEAARHFREDGDAIGVTTAPDPEVAGPDRSTSNAAPEVAPENKPSIAVTLTGDGRDSGVAKQTNVTKIPPWTPTTDTDLPIVEQRCRLKSEATRWSIARKAAIAAGSNFRIEIAPTDRAFFERANSIGDCSLWMLTPTFQMPNDVLQMVHLAACFRALADALYLIQLIASVSERVSDDLGENSIRILAEAQSALRNAVECVNDRGDRDQAAAFTWLRCTANERGIHIPRYMRLDDAPDHAEMSTLSARIVALASEVNNRLAVKRKRQRLYAKIHHLLDQLSHGNNARVENWQALAEAIDDLIATGVAPSNKEIRESLLPVIAGMPVLHDLPKGFSRVITQLDRHRFAQQRQVLHPKKPSTTPEVNKVRTLLRGRTVLLIGSHRRNHVRNKLKRALKLKRLNWISTTDYESAEPIRTAVSDPDVAVVLLASRISSHSLTQVQALCNENGKPLVRLPSGHNPDQVAFQILTQCGDRLRLTCEVS